MKSSRKPVATALLLVIHLLTLQIDDAVAKRDISNAGSNSKIILEEVIITGINGNDTRVTASAVAEDPSKIGEEVLAFLSNKDQTRRRRSKQTSNVDQDAAPSIIDDVSEDDLERLKRVIAKYEPQRITSRKAKRKIVDLRNDAHGARDKIAAPATDLDATYHEVLRNISRQTPGLTVRNSGATLNPYLTQTTKNLKPIYVAEATINPVNDNGAQKSRPDIDPSDAPFAIKNKKMKLFKKYLQLNRTVTSPPSRLDEETADESTIAPRGYIDKKYNEKTKNESLEWSSNVHSSATEKPDRRKWNIQESSAHVVPPFNLRLNNSNIYGAFNVNNLNNLNVPSVPSAVKPLRMAPSSYTIAPRPFSIAQPSLISQPVVVNLEATTYKKPSHSSANGLNHQKLSRSSANVLPLILPTDLFAPPSARHYVPTKHRAKHGNLDGNSATIVAATETNPTANSASEKTVLTDYVDVIGGTKNPPIAVNGQLNSGSPNFYSITEKPTTVLVPSPASVSYQPNNLQPKIAPYDSPSDEKSNLNANLELSLYNKFANLYNVPKVITQEYRNFKQPPQPVVVSQQVSAIPYATLSPFSQTLPKVQSIVPTKAPLAPYYDSGLLVSQNAGEKELDGKETVESSDQSRADDAGKTGDKEEEIDDKNHGNYKIQLNHGVYKIHETPNAPQREKNDREEEEKEDSHQEERRTYGPDKTDKEDKNDSEYESYENSKDKADEDEYADTKERDEHDDRYHRYDRDDSKEKQRDSQRDKYDYDIDFKRFDLRYNDDTERDKDYSTRYDRKKSAGNDRRKKSRKDREREDDDVADDKFGVQRFKDREQNEKYKKKRKNVSRKDDEEYSETNPKHVREKHHYDASRSEDNNEKVRDHVHGESKEHAHKHEGHRHGKDHGGDRKFEEGKGAEHGEEHHGHHGEKGDKGYKVWHEHEKAEKGHHDKEHATKEYDEKEGEEKKHEEDGGYHEARHHGEEGKKTAEFGEKGEHKKGHSTHGEHSVHKKDEYEKKTEFFDEFHEDGDAEKHGEHHHEHESKKGGHEKKGHHDLADEEKKYGEEGKYEKGGHHHGHKGHKVGEGHDHHYDHHKKHGEKEGHEHGKKWSYKKGDSGGDDGHKHDR